MISQRPYLFDAIYRWVLDNDCTPHLLVDAGQSGVQVPSHVIENDQVVLNINPAAIAGFESDDYGIYFSARFSGKEESIVVPFQAMIALFAKECGKGMVFPAELSDSPPTSPSPDSTKKKGQSAEKGGLKLVK